MQRGSAAIWIVWAIGTLVLGAALAGGLVLERAPDSAARAWVRSLLLPGNTSHGHHQIELACEACHQRIFSGPAALQEACVKCHGAELKEARDSHPRSKFTDPRNAERAAKLDATRCVTCHAEHRPGITQTAGLTLPQDFCVICHAEIGKERPSHQRLGFDTCASSGCHNFHDNRALYEDFLLKHAGEPGLLPRNLVPARDFVKVIEELSSYPLQRFPLKPVSVPDHASALRTTAAINSEWLASSHARAGVNCSGCHTGPAQEAPAWIERPGAAACATCHADEVRGFRSGKHGMREAAGLAPMQPRLAKVPMHADVAREVLSCVSCHGAHGFNSQRAAVEACSGCHADTHSRAYASSPHAALWKKELAGELPAGSGVTCATCHMPRLEHRTDDVKRVLVQHNQSDGLRPSEKMLRPVCMNCHGLAFSLDALADAALVARNFSGRPVRNVASIEMAKDAEHRANESRRKVPVPGT